MVRIICPSCAKEIPLDVGTYWNYQGDITHMCGAIMSIHTKGGELQSSPILKGLELIKINDLSPNIQNDVNEAQICQSVGAYKACVVMCRRALEQICDDKGANGHTLNDKIKSLYDNKLITLNDFEAFNEIRHFGNYGAHPNNDMLSSFDKSNAKRVFDVTIHVAKNVYEMPAIVRELKQQRTKA